MRFFISRESSQFLFFIPLTQNCTLLYNHHLLFCKTFTIFELKYQFFFFFGRIICEISPGLEFIADNFMCNE